MSEGHAGAPLVLALSPRAGGNSDAAAGLFARGAARALGAPVPVTRLREFRVRPCTACHACAGGGPCPQDADDDAGRLLAALAGAPAVFLAAPIYFYHLPAQAKALVDRSQRWYERARAADPAVAGLAPRPAYCCLVAGRPEGRRLFEGALLTLKYFLASFRLELCDPLTLRGVDAPGDLAADAGACAALEALGRRAVLGQAQRDREHGEPCRGHPPS